MNDGKRPKPRRWDSVSDPKYVITAEVDRETYDWLSRNAAEQGMTIRRWVGLKGTSKNTPLVDKAGVSVPVTSCR